MELSNQTFQIHPCQVRWIFVLPAPAAKPGQGQLQRGQCWLGCAGCALQGSSEVRRCTQSLSAAAGYTSRVQMDVGTAQETMGSVRLSGARLVSAVGAARSSPLNMHLGHNQLIGPACTIQCVAENTS